MRDRMRELFSGVKTSVSSSGVKIVAIPWGKTPKITATFVIRSGAEKDPLGKEGLANLTIEALGFGTTTMGFDVLHEEMEKQGASLEMGSSWDFSYITLSAPSSSFEFLVPLYKEIFFQPAFPQKEVHEAKNRRKAKLQKLSDIPSWVADQLIWNLSLKNSPYGHCYMGNLRSIDNLTCEDLKGFHDKYCRDASNVSIIIVGKEDAFRLLDLGLKIVEGFDDHDNTHFSEKGTFTASCTEEPKIIIIDRPDLTQSEIRVAFPGISRYDPDYHAFIVFNYILGGGGFSSILMDILRSKKGLTYGVKSYFYPLKIRGPMVISTYTPTAYTSKIFEEIIDIISSFPHQKNLEQYLYESKEFFKGSFPLRFETPEKLLKELVHLETYQMPLDELLLFLNKISEVKIDNVMRLADSYLKLEHLKAIIVGRVKDFLKDIEQYWGKSKVTVIDYKDIVGLL